MASHPLKRWRVVVAAAGFAGLTVALVDFRDAIPGWVGYPIARVQFIPALMAGLVGIWVAWALAALLVGRIYCSAVCPLGILQDLVARIVGWFRPASRIAWPYARPWTWARHTVLWATVAGVAASGAGFTFAMVDPYSNYGRVAADVFRPLVTIANNLVASLANALGIGTLYRVEPPWAGWGALHPPLILLGLLTVLVALRGRLYCNTLCPVGTLFGLLARRAAFRLTIEAAACGKCGDCLQSCKAQCIDLRTKSIDFARCVACYNCLGACPQRGIGYRFAWSRSPRPRPEPVPGAAELPRRAFLAEFTLAAVALGTARLRARGPEPSATAPAGLPRGPQSREPSGAVCPPGAGGVDRLLDRCTACHLCISVCPTHVLQPAFVEYGFLGVLKPRLDFTKGPCTYTCRACTAVCPDGALVPLELADKQLVRIGEARLDVELCIVKTKGTDCAACSEQCPTQAVTTVPYGANLRLPRLNLDYCTGCGGCEFACPVQPRKAITVTGFRRHARAQRPVDTKAAAPNPGGGFPF